MDDLEFAINLSLASYQEEQNYQMFDEYDAALAASKALYEKESRQRSIEINKKQFVNNCADLAFCKIYRAVYGRDFTGSIREELRQRWSRETKIDPVLYAVAEGEQLSYEDLDYLFKFHEITVAYIRQDAIQGYLGNGTNPQPDIGILHTVMMDYVQDFSGHDRDSLLAGHYEPVRYIEMNGAVIYELLQ